MLSTKCIRIALPGLGFSLLLICAFVSEEPGTRLLVCSNMVFVAYGVKSLTQLRHAMDLGQKLTSLTSEDSRSAAHEFLSACTSTLRIKDDIHARLTIETLEAVASNAHKAVLGNFSFESTEAWRATYADLLSSPGLHTYRSVALVHSPDYWQSEAGLKSLELNQRLSRKSQLQIERIVILADLVWPNRARLPAESIQQWLIEQHHDGIVLWLIDEAELSNEPDLLVDLGIYGSRATGSQRFQPVGRHVGSLCSLDSNTSKRLKRSGSG